MEEVDLEAVAAVADGSGIPLVPRLLGLSMSGHVFGILGIAQLALTGLPLENVAMSNCERPLLA